MIKVVATATAGTILHTAVSGTDDFDEISIWAMNSDGSNRLLTIEVGGVTDPDDLIEQTMTTIAGLEVVVPKGALRLNGGVVVRAFAAAANVIVCMVAVNRRSA